ncbi:MAG: hypothetical protein R3F19_01140 [Verrucomicrobiales bacterium]
MGTVSGRSQALCVLAVALTNKANKAWVDIPVKVTIQQVPVATGSDHPVGA